MFVEIMQLFEHRQGRILKNIYFKIVKGLKILFLSFLRENFFFILKIKTFKKPETSSQISTLSVGNPVKYGETATFCRFCKCNRHFKIRNERCYKRWVGMTILEIWNKVSVVSCGDTTFRRDFPRVKIKISQFFVKIKNFFPKKFPISSNTRSNKLQYNF